MENRNTARIPHYIRSAVSIAFKLLVIFIVASFRNFYKAPIQS